MRIGSKGFTESIVLGELASQALRAGGVDARHLRQLGGSRILYTALSTGALDVYPEYTGTLALELLAEETGGRRVDEDTLRELLAGRGLRMSPPIGFSNSYALGMRADRARELGIRSIGDLRDHPELNFGVSSEFMERGDGWRSLARHYGLPHTRVRGMSHDLAYRALDSGAIDVIDLYTTDAEIRYYDLVVLEDDLDHFPAYEAVWLYRSELAERRPEAVAILHGFAGSIDAAAMTAMNAAVKLEGRSSPEVAARHLGLPDAPEGDSLGQRLRRTTLEHLQLTGVSLGLAILVAVPLGIVSARRPRAGHAVLATTGILQTVPSLAMFVFMIPFFGIGAQPAIVALLVYSLLPIVRNTHAGLAGISPELRESAEVLGLTPRARLWQIELPLAAPSILAGIKTAAVINVGTATLAALIGAGGYGQPIITGIRLDSVPLIMEGAIPAALLALLIQWLFDGLERSLSAGSGASSA